MIIVHSATSPEPTQGQSIALRLRLGGWRLTLRDTKLAQPL
jgi:hypothetical protein